MHRLTACAVAFLVACGEDAPPPGVDADRLLGEATVRVFGEGFDAAAVVARVDGHSIRVGDLALCRERAPAWTLRRCLDDLVEIAVLTARATDDDRLHPVVTDARQAALASALLRDLVDLPLADATLTEQDLRAFVADPNNLFYFGRPALRQTSHLLVRGSNGASPEARALAERIYNETAWPEQATVADLDRARSSFSGAAAEAGLDVRVERHFLAQAENAPGRAWPGIPPLAQPFADALFAIPRIGAVSPPTDTDFGTHLILFEVDYPAVVATPEETATLARHELGQRRRVESLNALRDQLLERADVVRHDTIDLFRLSDEQLIRQRSSSMREQFGPQSP